jgi:hypothetical protein
MTVQRSKWNLAELTKVVIKMLPLIGRNNARMFRKVVLKAE